MRVLHKVSLAVGLVIGFGANALAADMPSARKVVAPVPAAYNWSGLYAGVNAGYGWGNNSVNGAIGGLQAGYNLQTGNFIWGVETDIQATGQKESVVVSGSSVTIRETDKLPWFGTTRLRAGWAADRWFFYGTGGVAYGEIKESGTATGALTGSYSGSNTKTGWTAGAGIEAAMSNNWSWKLEYLHANLGSFTNTYRLTGGSLTIAYPRAKDDIARLGLNYHF